MLRRLRCLIQLLFQMVFENIKKFFYILFFFIGSVNAQSCDISDFYTETGWNIQTDLNGIQNGRVIGSNVFAYSVDINDLADGGGFSLFAYLQKNTVSNNIVPLETLPGLGIRFSWGLFENKESSSISPSPPGVIFIGRDASNIIEGQFTEVANNRKFTLKWVFELIVIDVKVYAGGDGGDLSREGLGISIGNFILNNGRRIPCSPPFANIDKELIPGGVLALPILPKPPTPTCQFPFHSHTQNVSLPAAPVMTLAENNAPREKGAYGQANFILSAQNCGADTKFEMYFTDNNLQGEIKNYLVTTGDTKNQVGIRLYAGHSGNPVVFGPAPTGSTDSTHPPAISEGPTSEGSSFIYPITAQYVRLPGVAVSDVQPSNVNAQAVVTVVYP